MKFSVFLKEKILGIVINIIVIMTIEFLLMINNYHIFIKAYVMGSIILANIIILGIEFFCKRNFYNNLKRSLENLENKYLVAEIINKPNFIEGRILKETLEETDKSMIENVNKYKYLLEDYKEYIELWIHEIKLPISASKMIVENNKNETTKSIDEELDKIENYVEQALFYARSNNLEKDYYIKKNKLNEIINFVIKKNKNILIQEKIKIDINIDKDLEVNTDDKWCIFILNQIIQNSIKYIKEEEKEIRINAEKKKEMIILCIEDTGIGIKEKELKRVFQKGFTGSNGRIINKKSTGIGLYLCKKLCDKMGIKIQIESIYQKGTTVKLIFPNGSFYEV